MNAPRLEKVFSIDASHLQQLCVRAGADCSTLQVFAHKNIRLPFEEEAVYGEGGAVMTADGYFGCTFVCSAHD